MYFHLDRLGVRLDCSDRPLERYLAQLLEGWLSEPTASAREVTATFELVDELPARPPGKHLFTAAGIGLSDDVGRLVVYTDDEELCFVFANSALVKLTGLEGSPLAGRIEAVVTAAVLRHGRLDDVLFTCLAPYLRRQGLYLAHAFAAVHHGRALLLVGPSGSGKTTTGLNLIHHGWQYLANDAVLLKQYPDGVYALPMPGGFNVSPQTWDVLPWLSKRVAPPTPDRPAVKWHLPAQKLVSGWGEAARIAAVCFPQVTQHEDSRLVPESQAVNLARLMENSLDRWDQASLSGHIALLQLLSSQAAGYNLYLGPGAEQLADRLARLVLEEQPG
jgi:hypothetical protein